MPGTRFLPSTHGLKFPNYWPPGTPDLIAHTLIGKLSYRQRQRRALRGHVLRRPRPVRRRSTDRHPQHRVPTARRPHC